MRMKSSDILKISFSVFICLLSVQAAATMEEVSISCESPGGVGTDPERLNPVTFPDLFLFFVPNEGQAGPGILFSCAGKGYSISYAKDRVEYSFPCDNGGIDGRCLVVQRFSGSNPDPVVEGLNPKSTRVSYFSGGESERHTNITPYDAVLYRDLYPGIDLVYRGISGTVKREFLVHPGADPSQIRMRYEGAGQVRMAGDGGLVIKAGSGEIRESTPVCYQDVGEIRVEIPCRFDVWEDGSVSFYLGAYDPALPLLIDPALVYCGYFGSDEYDSANGIAVDTSGNTYLTGIMGGYDAYIAKVNAEGTELVYCGMILGDGTDWGESVTVDAAGNAYFTGYTGSDQASFPDIVGPDTTYNGGDHDAFVAKIDASGTYEVYCGYIGGIGDDKGLDIAVDTAGNAYVIGYTSSTEASFPEIAGPNLTYGGGPHDIFVAKVNPDGTGLTYCGYLGGSKDDQGWGIAVDSAGNAFLAGTTISREEDTFPVKGGPDLTWNGGNDAFVAKVNAAGTGLTYCGYIGGSGYDYASDIAVDRSGNAYAIGYTSSSEATFPETVGPDLVKNTGEETFVAKVNSAGTALTYCGYIGGAGDDWGTGISVDTTGHAYVTGYTDSPESSFPVKGGPDVSYNGAEDAFVAKVNSGGTGLMYCGYIGGSGSDYGYSIAVDSANNGYIAGSTGSSEATFPVKGGPDLHLRIPGSDAFIAKLGPDFGIGVFRPGAQDNWILDRSIDGKIDIRDHYGLSGDIPLVYDIKGDWIADRMVFRSGEWIEDYNIDGTVNNRDDYGMAGDIPLGGDFNSDGIPDQAVFRGTAWYNWIYDLDRDGDVDRRDHFGTSGDIPLVGDFNNDGVSDRGVFRPSAYGNWIIDLGSDGSVNIRDHYGTAEDIPLIGDFNADGSTDRAAFRNGEWIMDYDMDGTINSRLVFGMRGDIPVVWAG